LRRRGIDTRSLYTVTRSWKGVVQSCFDWLILQRLKLWVSLIPMLNSLMGHQENDWFAMQQLKREFPNMMRSISAYKWKCDASGEKGTSKFAIKLHGIEAAIIADVAKKCMDGYIPCVSVFDGMLVPANDAQVVKDFFTEVLTKRLGFAPEPSVETAGGENMRLEVG